MKHIGLKVSSTLTAALLVVLTMAQPSRSLAQMKTSDQGVGDASIHGHVNNPVGQAITKGDVKLSNDFTSPAADRKYQYTFPLDASGDYKGANIKPDKYIVFVFQDTKSLDFNDGVILTSGADKTVNFDMTRPEYIKALPPEEQKQIEEYKKKNAEVVASNAKVQNLNAMLTEARADNKAGNYDAAITSMQQATAVKGDEGILWITLGDAQLGSADAAAKAAKAAGTPTTDPAIAAKYNDAAASYKKGIDLNAASKKPNPEAAAAGYNQLGQVYGKLGNAKDSADSYELAAKAQPTNAAMYYFNEAATLYNAGKLPEAEAAADRAIAADPKKAEAYYIKGQALITQAKEDPATKKIVAPPGCMDAYQMYLQLAPDGGHAADVKAILAGFGEQVKSSYKAPKK